MTGTAIARLEPVRSDLIQLARTAHGYAEAGKAENTRRAYRGDWADFTSWCASVDARPLPAEAATIAMYLTARAPTHAASTLARRLAAIRTAHREADEPVPASNILRQVWSGIRRAHGRPPRQKRALITEDLRRVVAALPATPRGLRDRAIILIGFAAALRRSELSAIVLDGPGVTDTVRLEFVPHGLQIHIDRSKADQEGRGAVVGVPYGKTRLCPVAALEAWLKAASIASGPVFRPINRHGAIGPHAINGAAVAAIVKAAAEGAGLDPVAFAAHSLRAGLVTSAVAAGVATDVIMRQTRHAKYDTLRGYIRDGERFKRNAAGKVGL